MKLLLATHNPAKVSEFREGLQPLCDRGWQLVSLSDMEIEEEPAETGTTIVENAILKATYYGKKTSLETLSDDSGFFIPALGGEPGVLSNRWLGRKATDEELIAYTLTRMQHLSDSGRRAYLELCICLYNPNKDTYTTHKERIEGSIAYQPASHWERGFPYRALLLVDAYHKYYDALTPEEHKAVNHRLRAMQQVCQWLGKSR